MFAEGKRLEKVLLAYFPFYYNVGGVKMMLMSKLSNLAQRDQYCNYRNSNKIITSYTYTFLTLISDYLQAENRFLGHTQPDLCLSFKINVGSFIPCNKAKYGQA